MAVDDNGDQSRRCREYGAKDCAPIDLHAPVLVRHETNVLQVAGWLRRQAFLYCILKKGFTPLPPFSGSF
jgi:hypothetical protein